METKCKNKKIIRVLVRTVDNKYIVGYVCYQKDYEQDEFLGLYLKDEPVIVYKLNSPNTGVAEQAGYETLTFSQEQIRSITRHSEVDPEIEP